MPYFRFASYILIITSASHLAGHFLLIPQLQLVHTITGDIPRNETESTLFRLMNNYHRNIGGTALSMMDILNGLSLCYAVFFFWLGSLNLLVYRALRRNHRILTRISFLNSFMLAVGAVVSVIHFFWLPVISFGLSLVLFLLAGWTFSKSRQF